MTSSDLVSYLVIEVLDRRALAALADPLLALEASGTVAILDGIVVEVDADGIIEAIELDEVEELAALRAVLTTMRLLTEQDVGLAAMPIRPSSVGLILLTEDRWAAPIADAVAPIGGRIAGGERVPAWRLDRVLCAPRRENGAA